MRICLGGEAFIYQLVSVENEKFVNEIELKSNQPVKIDQSREAIINSFLVFLPFFAFTFSIPNEAIS